MSLPPAPPPASLRTPASLSAPPDIAAFGEKGEADNLGGHPGVGPRGTHFGRLVPLSGKAEVCDLEHRVSEVMVLNGLQDQDCGLEEGSVTKTCQAVGVPVLCLPLPLQ